MLKRVEEMAAAAPRDDEVAVLRAREAAARAEATALTAALDVMSVARSAPHALLAFLASLRATMGCDTVVLMRRESDTLVPDTWCGGAPMARVFHAGQRLAGPECIPDLSAVAWCTPGGGAVSWLSVPVKKAPQEALLVCLSGSAGAFDASAEHLLSRMAPLAAHALSVRALTDRVALLAAVVETAPHGVAIRDGAGRRDAIVYSNAAYQALADTGPVAPSDPSEAARLAHAEASGTPATFHLSALGADGRRVHRDLSVYPVRGEEGEVRYLAKSVTDVTERAAALAARETAESQLTSALSTVREGFILLDAGDKVVFANDTFRGFYPTGGTDFVPGQRFVEAWARHRQRAGASAEAAAVAGAARLQRMRSGHGGVEEKLPDDVIVTVSERVTPDGGCLALVTDVTHHRAGERERARLIDELSAAQRRETVSVVALGLAHDLNNVMAAVNGSAELLGDAPGLDSAAKGHARRILSAGRSVASLIDRLLDLGRRETVPERLDLAAALTGAMELVRMVVGPPIEMQLTLPKAPVSLVADATQIVQLVLNLAINARDAIAANGREAAGRITVRGGLTNKPSLLAGEVCAVGALRPRQDMVLIEVADTGCGIAPGKLAATFEPYRSTKSATPGASGHGLGLAVVAGIVSGMGGAVTVTSRVGEGTVFRILLPQSPLTPPGIAFAPEAATGATAAAGAASGAGKVAPEPPSDGAEDVRPLAGRVILVVDDEPATTQLASIVLERAGAEVAACQHPADALACLEEDPGLFDGLVTDLDMPETPGDQLAAAVRRHAPTLPIMLLTGEGDWHNVVSDASLFDAVALKPLNNQELVAAVRRLVGRSAARAGREGPCGS